MSKWKKSGKRILVLLLAVALAGGMLEHSQVTVTAADAEGEIPETEGSPKEGEETPQTENAEAPKAENPPAEDAKLPGTENPPAENTEPPKTENPPAENTELPEKENPPAENAKLPETENSSAEDTELPEKENPPVENTGTPKAENKEEQDNEPVLPEPTCICTVRCTEETAETDCPVCKEDLSGCKVKAADEPEADGPKEPVLNPDSVLPEGEENPDAQDPDKPDEAVTAVQELMEALPSLEELKEMDEDGQRAAYDQIQAAFDAYEELTEEQKAQLEGAEELFQELLEYFTEPVMLAATDDQVKGAWNAMTAAMENWEASVDLSSYNITEAEYNAQIWPNVVTHNPDLFYMLDGILYTDNNEIVQRVQFTYNSNYNQTHVDAYKAAIQKVLDEVIRSNGSMNDEQKALALHDYLIQHMEYDQNAFNNSGKEKRNAYEALINGIGVCEGYALAYAALLKAVNIEVDFCESREMNHIWNYVKLNGNWYHVDPTYDDVMAASQFGATGSAKHEYFLLSDSAMQSKPNRNWEVKGKATDQSYDNSWHKTDPSTGSAVYTVNGSEYYLKKETVINNANICRGAALIKRTNGSETKVASIDIKNMGGQAGQWPMYQDSYSRLSYSGGILYFNVGNSVYSYNPSIANAAPTEIYEYNSTDGRILSGLLVSGDKMILETYKSGGTLEKTEAPLFTVKASEEKIKVGYTTPPILTATAQASSFVWEKFSNGSWQTISGASGSSYTVETGLAAGTYNYRVTASLNGKTVTAYAAITVIAQEEQKNFGFSENTKTVTYGDADFTVTAQGAEAGSSVTYSSSDTSVALVDRTTGAVQILKAGTAVITAEASETADYLNATSTYNLTVVPKALTWDTGALEARDRLDQIKDRAATLYGELKLAGILEKDVQAVQFSCPSEKLAGLYETAAEGSQKVFLSWKDAQDTAVLQGSGAGNYTMPAALPEITGIISVNTSILVPSDDENSDTKLMVNVESGISEVPETFKEKEHLNTPGKIEKEMKVTLQGKYSGIQEERIVVYDVELLIQVDGNWRKATVEEFPSNGLTLTLPYPSGTGKDTHDFVVTHMFTKDMNGFRAGDVEYPSVSKTNEGLAFKVYGLSPISIGWKDVERSSSSSRTRRDESPAAAPASAVSNVNSAPTGDSSQAAPYLFLALISLSVLAELYIRRKKVNR